MSETLRKQLPAFANEAEEAEWWFDNRESIGLEFAQAIDDGRVTRGAMRRRGLVPTPSIELDPDDFSQAQAQAEKKGMRCQTYIRMLIHEGLERDASKLNTGSK